MPGGGSTGTTWMSSNMIAVRVLKHWGAVLLMGAVMALAHLTPIAAQDAAAVIYLVRHAERADGGSGLATSQQDPELSAVGLERTEALTRVLADAGITRVLTSDYRRTRQTVAPLAEMLGLELEVYDPRDLAGTASLLKSLEGRTLVSGHSNTTPELVELLGGDSGPPFGEDYDRIYILVLGADGSVTTTLVRFEP